MYRRLLSAPKNAPVLYLPRVWFVAMSREEALEGGIQAFVLNAEDLPRLFQSELPSLLAGVQLFDVLQERRKQVVRQLRTRLLEELLPVDASRW